MNANELLERAKQWCVEHGQEPDAANLERIVRNWRYTGSEDYGTCSEVLAKITQPVTA